MPKKDRTLDPRVRDAAVNLRVVGMSERSVYERLRDILDTPPSYRDLRAAYSDAGVRYRHEASEARAVGRFVGKTPPKSGRSEYFERWAVVREVDQTEDARDAFDRRYVLGYLGREVLPTEEEAEAGQVANLDLIADAEAETFDAMETQHRSP